MLLEKMRECPFIFALTGRLGGGKTTFTQGLGEYVGIRRALTSPTFVIEKEYPIHWKECDRLIHIDAYRIGEDDARGIGLPEMTRDTKNIIVIEWADRIAHLLPAHTLWVSFVPTGATHRTISVNIGSTPQFTKQA